ncbi:MAG: right-handed parallel beta-helix repeat-containing protein [Fibrobacteria bacterium]|nr:right-handed parallel beta-helix repeat-containing protein [Fibrobacteria bacterium]
MKVVALVSSAVCALSTLASSRTIVLEGLTSTVVNIRKGADLGTGPGDTIAIPAGEYAAGLRFIDLHGDSLRPIVIRNQGGRVLIQAPKYHGIAFQRSSHVVLAGDGDPSLEYGIVVDTVVSGGVGVAVGDLSTDFEIHHLEIRRTGFAGIMAKTDPNCSDSATWRRNGFVLRNLRIHHNYIHDTHGEGMYIGYTGGYLVKSKQICDGTYAFGHWLENVEVDHNRVERAGWDGIQVNLVRRDGSIHHNTIHNYGLAKEPQQNFGMSVGGGIYSIHANLVTNDSSWGPQTASGIQLINGASGCSLTHNVFAWSGGYGIFMHARNPFDDPSRGYLVANNTVAYPVRSGIFYNDGVTEALDTTLVGKEQPKTPYVALNNLVLSPVVDYASQNFWKKDPETYMDFNTRSQRDAHLAGMKGNVGSRRPDTLGLKDPAGGDFRISRSSSPLVDAGLPVGALEGATDPDGTALPLGRSVDVGAFEFLPTDAVLYRSPRAGSEAIRVHDLLGRRLPGTPEGLRLLVP